VLLDKQNLFSDAQDLAQVAGSYLSTNTLDTGAVGTIPGLGGTPIHDIGRGGVPRLLVQVVETFTSGGAATLQVQFVQADNAALSTNLEVLSETRVHALADLVIGKQFGVSVPPGVNRRYVGVRYVIGTATTTAGKCTAGLVWNIQTNVSSL
jgi:Bbp16-like protein